MKWLDNIQWQRDLGVDLRMMNNQAPPNRNQWYMTVLEETVKDKDCLEIGFGAGLLSLIALEVGARHITAWEADKYRYQLGCHIIKQLGLESKISLHQGKYNSTTKPKPDTVIFHEIIGPNIWQEGLRSSLPIGDNLIVPGQYVMDFEIFAITESQFQDHFYPYREFSPKVNINAEYIKLVNQLIEQSPNVVNNRTWYTSRMFNLVDKANFYDIDVNNIASIPQSYTAGVGLPVSNTDRFILYPKSSIRHNSHELFWSYYDPILVPKYARSVTITQNFDTGLFTVLDT
jgi:hypothetical protein